MSISIYKIVTYVPPTHFQDLVKALKKTVVNNIGSYSNCISYQKVTSTWTADKTATPYIGLPGREWELEEYRVAFLCEASRIEEIASVIRSVHPYEEPMIEAYPVTLL